MGENTEKITRCYRQWWLLVKNFSYIDHFGFDPLYIISVDKEAKHNIKLPHGSCSQFLSKIWNIWNFQYALQNLEHPTDQTIAVLIIESVFVFSLKCKLERFICFD